MVAHPWCSITTRNTPVQHRISAQRHRIIIKFPSLGTRVWVDSGRYHMAVGRTAKLALFALGHLDAKAWVAAARQLQQPQPHRGHEECKGCGL